MKLKELLDVIRYSDNEVDIRVTYKNEYDEECNMCMTFVPEKKFKANKEYWASKVIKYDCLLPIEKLDRYYDFEVSILHADGKDHFFIFACNL